MELLIYKASAGSGKTFTLAVEYIKRLIINPAAYRHILAVTFTNKATTEMKERILQQLWGIWQGEADSESYLQALTQRLEAEGKTFAQAEIQQRAGIALKRILHDYNRFQVTTIDSFFQMVKENQYKIQYRVMMARYRGKTTCPKCHGTRLKQEAEYVKIDGRSITDLVQMPISRLKQWFDGLKLNEHDAEVGKRLLTEITSRLQFLLDVGLGYLTLNRLSNTLSGGESQRINLCTSLGSSLVGSLYILDEPSIGLHSRDTNRLIKVLRELQALGNTVVVVEHDEEIIRSPYLQRGVCGEEQAPAYAIA